MSTETGPSRSVAEETSGNLVPAPPRSSLRLGSQNHSYSQFGDSVKCLLVQVFVTEGMLGAITVYVAKEQMESTGCLSRPDTVGAG